ncbi:MAG: hypothetical protein AAFN77_02880 [Planctomycetota bacterium]
MSDSNKLPPSQFQRRANTEKGFLLKYLFIGIGCFAFFLWSTYDAFIKYPGQIPRAQAWETLTEDKSLDDAQQQERWKEIATENGWGTKRPTKKESVDSIQQKVIWNYVFMAIGLALAAPNIIWYLSVNNSWIEVEAPKIRDDAGREFDVTAITRIDKKKWEKKGIAVITYSDHTGEQTFIIDDLKYERKPSDEIMEWIESQVERDIIVNGLTEVENREATKKKRQVAADAGSKLNAGDDSESEKTTETETRT